MLNLKHLKAPAELSDFVTLRPGNSYRTCFPAGKRTLNNYFMGGLTTSVQHLCFFFRSWFFTNINATPKTRLKSHSSLNLQGVENHMLAVYHLNQIHDSANNLEKISIHPIRQQFRSEAGKAGYVFTSEQY